MRIRIWIGLLALLIALSPITALATHGFGSTRMMVYVDGEPFLVYGYGSGDFVMDPTFSLRDIAYILNGTPFQFDITEAEDEIWDIWIGNPLTITGTELEPFAEHTYALFGSYGRVGWGDGQSGFPDPFPTTAVLNVNLWDVPPDTEFVHLRIYRWMADYDLMADKPNIAVEDFPINIPFTGIGGATLSIFSVEEDGEEVLQSHDFISFPDEAIFGRATLRVHHGYRDIEYHTLGVIHDLQGTYFSLFAIADLLGFSAEPGPDFGRHVIVNTAVSTPTIDFIYTSEPEYIDEPSPDETPSPETYEISIPDDNDSDHSSDDSLNMLSVAGWIVVALAAISFIVWIVRMRLATR